MSFRLENRATYGGLLCAALLACATPGHAQLATSPGQTYGTGAGAGGTAAPNGTAPASGSLPLPATQTPPVAIPPPPLRGTAPTPGFKSLGFPDSTTSAVPGADSSVAPNPNPAINYGKPRVKKSKLYRPDPKVSKPLSPLIPYATAPGTRKRGSNPQPDISDPPPPIAAIPVIKKPPKPKAEDTPFAPVGIGVGSLRLRPYVETSVGYDTNPNRVATGVKASVFGRVEGGGTVESDWDRHSLTADLRGGYSDYFNNHNADRPDGAAKVVGRIDVTRDTQINLEGRGTLDTQTPGSSLLSVPGSVFLASRPSILAFGTTAGVTQRFNRLSVVLKGTFDRYMYEDGTQSDGTRVRFSQNNYNDYGGVARVNYELTPGIIPFVELGADERLHDEQLDLYGYARNSTGFSGRAGSTFELTRLLTGEISGGYAERDYADPRLANLKGPTVDGSLIWTVTPLTTVTLKGSTALSETSTAGASGAVSRQVSLGVAHQLFRNFTLTGVGTYTRNDYQGVPIVENVFAATVGADYNLSREVVLRASYTREQLASTLAGYNYNANVFKLGVRLQR